MKIIRPETVTDSVFDTSNVAETISEYSASTVYYTGQTVRYETDHSIYESQTGAAPVVVSITVASPGVVTQTAHGLAADTPVAFSTDGTLPTGIVAGTVYYVRNPAADTYEVSATAGGSSINTSGSESGTHQVVSNPNKGNALSDVTKWVRTGPTNRWAMFDSYNQTQTSNSETIEVTLDSADRVTAVALLNIDAASFNLTMTDSVEGEIYNQTISLVDNSNVSDLYDYFFEPIIRRTDYVLTGLPVHTEPQIDLTVTNTGGTAKLGNFVMGAVRTLGATVYGAGFGLIDYSKKEFDAYGNATITERGYRKIGSFNVIVRNTDVNEIARLLALYRATPIVYIGTEEFSESFYYGFYRDQRIVVEHPQDSRLTIEIEGLV